MIQCWYRPSPTHHVAWPTRVWAPRPIQSPRWLRNSMMPTSGKRFEIFVWSCWVLYMEKCQWWSIYRYYGRLDCYKKIIYISLGSKILLYSDPKYTHMLYPTILCTYIQALFLLMENAMNYPETFVLIVVPECSWLKRNARVPLGRCNNIVK